MEPSPIDDTDIMRRTLTLCRLAKEDHLAVTQGRIIDVFRALGSIDWLNEDDFRLAVRTNLASSHEDEVKFDRIFQNFWHGTREEEGDYKPWRPELIRGDKQYGDQRGHDEMLADSEHFGVEEMVRDLNLSSRWDESAPPLEQVIRELAKRLVTRPSRRWQQAPSGRTIDIRRSVRRNVRHGMDMLELSRVKRRTRKTRIVLLSDVSGSMDAFNPFLLQLMLGLQRALKNSRTLVFSTKVTEVSSLLRRRSVRRTLEEIGTTVRHWSGGTDIGNALGKLNRGVLQEGTSRSTVAIIISDGYDNGSADNIAREMRVMRRRVKKIVWINPMYGATTFQVRAAGMKAALPFVDHFLPAFNAKSLQTLVRELGRI
jgi:hypothetical protein